MNKSGRWPNAHIKLRQLYEERAPKEMTQADFGKAYGIGTQGMVWQCLSGRCPLNIEIAAKFARGLRCTIRDISPEMADALEAEIVPMLGQRALKRAIGKMVLAAAAIFTLPPTPAQAFNISIDSIHIVFRWLRSRFA